MANRTNGNGRGTIVIDQDRCKGCALCVAVCPAQILQMSDGQFNAIGYRPAEVVEAGECTGCAMCAVICPDVAFTVYRRMRLTRASAKQLVLAA